MESFNESTQVVIVLNLFSFPMNHSNKIQFNSIPFPIIEIIMSSLFLLKTKVLKHGLIIFIMWFVEKYFFFQNF